jgi:transposase
MSVFESQGMRLGALTAPSEAVKKSDASGADSIKTFDVGNVLAENGTMVPVQEVLLDIPEQPEAVSSASLPMPQPAPRAPKLKPLDRSQGLLRPVIVEELVGPDHKVRAIWDLTGALDLSGFSEKIKSREGSAGSPAWDPRLLISVWLYCYSEQVSSAREISRLMEYEPGLMWLSGLGEVNHHRLAEFRTAYEKELQGLLAELLGMLSKEGFVKLDLVAHDGTKIRAQGGSQQPPAGKDVGERNGQSAADAGGNRTGDGGEGG